MPGKKAHKPKITNKTGNHGIENLTSHGRKSTGQTEGQFSRDGKGRKGQFTGAGESALTKK
jgi:hypothetical protein